jgi:carbon-monoxide dehydrogenase medium subunit
VDEALSLLSDHAGDAKPLAGGQSLIPAMNFRLATPAVLVDLNAVPDLAFITATGSALRIGGMTRHRTVEHSEVVRQSAPLLHETMPFIAHAAVRTRGTIGGSLAHADPAADYPASILALDAEMEVAGPRGRRTIKASAFFTDLLTTAIAADEILIEIRVPATAKTVAYVKTEQKASGFALAGVAVVISADGVRVGVTGIAAKAYRATAVEQALAGQAKPKGEAIALAAAHAADGVDPLGDIHASPEFRAHLAEINTRRAIEQALARG